MGVVEYDPHLKHPRGPPLDGNRPIRRGGTPRSRPDTTSSPTRATRGRGTLGFRLPDAPVRVIYKTIFLNLIILY